MTKDYPLFIKWRGLVSYLLDLSGKYPKNVRFNLCDRITTLSLDAMELIVEAIYTKQRSVPLKKLNLTLEKIRVLMQISEGNEAYFPEAVPLHCIGNQRMRENGWRLE